MIVNLSLSLGFKDFFDNIDEWTEKLRVLKEASNFLVEVIQENLARDMKEQVLMIDRRFSELQKQITQFLQQEGVERSRQEYREGATRLRQWLERAEQIVTSRLDCTYTELKEYVQQLDVSIKELYYRIKPLVPK